MSIVDLALHRRDSPVMTHSNRLVMVGRLWIALTFLAAASCQAAEPVDEENSAPKSPNIILFLVDDLGWQDLSVPLHTEETEFNKRYQTPNVERLAASGVVFTSAYASAPVCTPTRTSIMTGQDPARTQITYWTLNKDSDTSKSRPDLRAPAWRMNGLSQDDVTLPKLLTAAGYRTIHVGKAHFGAHQTSGADPQNLGFEINIAGHASGAPASFYGLHNFSSAGRANKPDGKPSQWDVPGLEKYHGQDVYLTEALCTETLPELRAAHEDGQPFFLNFCTYAVHAPIMANKRLLDDYTGLDQREAAYATMVESYDNALGLILDELDTLGIREETLVIFASDNGGLSAHARGGEAHTHNAPLRSGKGSAYEGGTRVPTVIRWPGVARAGEREDTAIISQDFFSTIVNAAGANLPQGLDSRDLAPLLRDAKGEIKSRTLGWNQPHQWGASGPGIEPFTSIREGAWKLIYFHSGRRFELYDLAHDIGETSDLAQDMPGRVILLAKVMQDWIDNTGAQLSIDPAKGREILGPYAVSRGMH